MERDRKKRLEQWKTAAIVLLAVSALLLTIQVQLYTGGTREASVGAWIIGLVSRIGNGEAKSGAQGKIGSDYLDAFAAVRISVRNENGRHGVQYEALESEELYNTVGNLLAEAVGSAGTPVSVSEETWRAALRNVGVYFDFLGRIPLSALSEWLGAENTGLEGSARRLLLALDEESTPVLYFIDETDGVCYACSTAVPRTSLTSDLSGFSPNGASFAFELGEAYASLPPYTMILPETPRLYVLSASNPMLGEENRENLLKAFDFNPHTKSRYTEANGTEVVIESLRTLRVDPSGTVQYHNSGLGEGSKLRIPSSDALPSVTEILEYTLDLAQNTVGALAGEGKLYLMELDSGGETGTCTVRFGYLADGTGVYLYEEGYAVMFEIQSGVISDATLHFRRYSATGTLSLILPERQTAAIITAAGGSDLALSYLDGGGEEVRAGWLARSQR